MVITVDLDMGYISGIILLNKVAFLEDSTFGQIKGDYPEFHKTLFPVCLNLNCADWLLV